MISKLEPTEEEAKSIVITVITVQNNEQPHIYIWHTSVIVYWKE